MYILKKFWCVKRLMNNWKYKCSHDIIIVHCYGYSTPNPNLKSLNFGRESEAITIPTYSRKHEKFLWNLPQWMWHFSWCQYIVFGSTPWYFIVCCDMCDRWSHFQCLIMTMGTFCRMRLGLLNLQSKFTVSLIACIYVLFWIRVRDISLLSTHCQ